MNFLTIVIAFGASFITINYIIDLFAKPKSSKEETDDCRITNTMHTWYYGDDGYMRCRICKKIALED